MARISGRRLFPDIGPRAAKARAGLGLEFLAYSSSNIHAMNRISFFVSQYRYARGTNKSFPPKQFSISFAREGSEDVKDQNFAESKVVDFFVNKNRKTTGVVPRRVTQIPWRKNWTGRRRRPSP